MEPYLDYLKEAASPIEVYWDVAPESASGTEYIVMSYSGNVLIVETLDPISQQNQTILYYAFSSSPLAAVNLCNRVYSNLAKNRIIYSFSGITTEATETGYHVASRTITLGK